MFAKFNYFTTSEGSDFTDTYGLRNVKSVRVKFDDIAADI